MTGVKPPRSALAARALSVGYRTRGASRPVLENLDLSIHAGELVCLLGPNGIGKSTLLRTIARIQPPLSGQIEIAGSDLRRLSSAELARKLGVVLTERVEVGSLPAYRVVELGRYPHLGWSGKLGPRDHEVVRWAIEAVGARGLANQDCNKLSDGERQRLMIARALAQEPAMLLLDEPTAFLDLPSRVELMGLLRQLAREQGVAVLLSSHDLELALRMADTAWLVAPGGRMYAGAPEDVVLSGRVAETFQSTNIQFEPAERSFRLVAGVRSRARVEGCGLEASLAKAVLEREGYALSEDCDVALIVRAEGGGWEAQAGQGRISGRSFRELAQAVRAAREALSR